MNMATISQLLQYILSKRYGEEVRGAIHDAIEKCYQDVNSATLREDAFQAALQAAIDHGDIPGMVIADNSVPGTKIQDGTLPLSKLAEPVQITVDSALSATSTNPVQNKVIKGTIDELNGSLEILEENMERVPIDVREAILSILSQSAFLVGNDKLEEIETLEQWAGVNPHNLVSGYYDASGNIIEQANAFADTKYIRVKPDTTYYWLRIAEQNAWRVCFYDKDKTFIERKTSTDASAVIQSFESSENAAFARLSWNAYDFNLGKFKEQLPSSWKIASVNVGYAGGEMIGNIDNFKHAVVIERDGYTEYVNNYAFGLFAFSEGKEFYNRTTGTTGVVNQDPIYVESGDKIIISKGFRCGYCISDKITGSKQNASQWVVASSEDVEIVVS